MVVSQQHCPRRFTFQVCLSRVEHGELLTESEAIGAFTAILDGHVSPEQIGRFLVALRNRGETVDEITGAARVLRAKSPVVEVPPGTIDTCGTGGDHAGTFNISTATALVVAACGVPVAKHGSRRNTSKCGSADLLDALGLNVETTPAISKRSLRDVGIGFFISSRNSTVTRHMRPSHPDLGNRTIFKFLWPICSPARVQRQLIGVFSPYWVRPLAEVLARLGTRHAWIVHGQGLDELTTTGPSIVAEVKDSNVRIFEIAPEDAGLPYCGPQDLRGGEPPANAEELRCMLDGKLGPLRNVVLLNSAGALIVAGAVNSLTQGACMAAAAIDSGKARNILDQLHSIYDEATRV